LSGVLDEHLGYVADDVRNRRFREAVSRVVKPGDVIVDLGCGSGILGLMCLKAGASRLISIDSTPILEIARETFARAGYGDRCEFISGQSFRIATSELADIVICDHVGYVGFDYGILELLRDARTRFLKPHGILLPCRLRLMIGPVQSGAARKKADGWRDARVASEFHWLGSYGINAKHAVELKSDEIIGPPAVLGEIDLRHDQQEFFSWTTELMASRDAVLHGIAGWFECELADGIWMTNAPHAADAIHRPQAFLPIEEPIALSAGDRIKVTVMTRPVDSLIAWSVEMPALGRRFDHSTWKGLVLGASDLLRTKSDRVPRLSAGARARTVVLSYCDGQRSARQIEELVLRDHPDLFPVKAEVSRFVAEVLARDTE
jgi:protein arginine N-methyltransferase 1